MTQTFLGFVKKLNSIFMYLNVIQAQKKKEKTQVVGAVKCYWLVGGNAEYIYIYKN